MKVKVTIEKIVFETREIELDEKFRVCACSDDEVYDVPASLFSEAADAVSKILDIPLAGDSSHDDSYECICAAECVDNGELIFEL